jgi:DNA (cytosine-5)-methyltransferase 1
VGKASTEEALNVLELFAGSGGGIQAAGLLGHRVICAVERDPFCREVLMARQEDGTIPPFPIWDDARTFDGKPWRGTVDVVSGGFPCQPFSQAGKQKAEQDDRNLWPDTVRIICEVRPRVVFLENVPGLVRLYLPRVLGDLAEAGYDSEWCVLGAGDIGAPHIRKRLWIMA